MNSINLTPLINTVIAILAAVITPRLIRWLNARASAQELETLYDWVKIAVAAAEQIFPVDKAEEKKRYVFDYLKAHNFTIDFDDIDKAIEAAVLELHTGLYGKNGGGDNDRD